MSWMRCESEGLRMSVGFWLGQLRERGSIYRGCSRKEGVGFVRDGEFSLIMLRIKWFGNIRKGIW